MGKSLQLMQHEKRLEIVCESDRKFRIVGLYENTVLTGRDNHQRRTEQGGYWDFHQSRKRGCERLERDGRGVLPVDSLVKHRDGTGSMRLTARNGSAGVTHGRVRGCFAFPAQNSPQG